ncbi:MAG: NAD(P)-binding protein [Pseudomonadota bacterium]
MSGHEHFDAIIIGAGPSGLAIGSELSDDFKVLVIDKKNTASKTQRSWFVPKFAVTEGGAEELLDPAKGIVYRDDPHQIEPNGVRAFLTKTMGMSPRAWDSQIKDGYPFIEEHALLDYWAGLLQANETRTGSRLLLNTVYFDHEVFVSGPTEGDTPRKHVEVRTNKGNFTTDLLIDGSGHESLIRMKYGYNDNDFMWWSVYGALVDHPGGLGVDETSGRPLRMGDYLLWGTYRDTNPDLEESLSAGRPVFEYEILWEDRKDGDGAPMLPRSFPLILYLRDEKVSEDVMKAEFEHILRKEPTTKAFHGTKIVERKWGWYPSGGISQGTAADHVAFVGDAACWTTPCGWGMAFILRNYKSYSRKIKGALQANKVSILDDDPLSAHHLKGFVNLGIHDWNQILLDRVATRFLSHAPAHAINDFVEIWGDGPGQVPFVYCEYLFTLSISHPQAVRTAIAVIRKVGLETLVKLFPPRELLSLAMEVPLFAADALLTAIQRHTDVLDDCLPALNRSGFDFE